MEVSSFFTRLLQTPKQTKPVRSPDDWNDFNSTWISIKATLELPDERQLVKGIGATAVPLQLKHLVDALVYEGNRTDDDTTGMCLEYLLKNDLLGQLERLCERDQPHGIKTEVVRTFNNLIVLLSEQFLVHNAVHRPLRRLLRSCVGNEPEERVDGGARVLGAAAVRVNQTTDDDEFEAELVDLMCGVCSRMRSYPPLLLVFFHDNGWIHPITTPNSSTAEGVLSSDAFSTMNVIEFSAEEANSRRNHCEFLIFSYLLRFAHKDDRTGDMARAGLLFLFDIAFHSVTDERNENLSISPTINRTDPLHEARGALAKYILDSDFSDVMAAGLCATYSVLPSKLRVPSLSEFICVDHTGSPLTSVGGRPEAVDDIDTTSLTLSTDHAVHTQLSLLLKLIGFIQDIIHRCGTTSHDDDFLSSGASNVQLIGPAVSNAILDAVQHVFVGNVLYPSILECSDSDGSAVAVLTFLDVLFTNLESGPLLNGILVALFDTNIVEVFPSDVESRLLRRYRMKGYNAQSVTHADYYSKEGKYTLRDLILDNISSISLASNISSLRLLDTLLRDHCQSSFDGLLDICASETTSPTFRLSGPFSLNVEDTQFSTAINSSDVHALDTELYLSLLRRLNPLKTKDQLSNLNDTCYLTDAQIRLQSDQCLQASHVPLQFLASHEGDTAYVRVGERIRNSSRHSVDPSDPIVCSLVSTLARFFEQCPDKNVALTGTLATIAMCPNRSLSGWLLLGRRVTEGFGSTEAWSDDASFDDNLEESIYRKAMFEDVNPAQLKDNIDIPVVYQVLRDLVGQVCHIKQNVEDFDNLLAVRRRSLMFPDNVDETIVDNPNIDSTLRTPTSTSVLKEVRDGGVASSLRSLLSPRKWTSPVVSPSKPAGSPNLTTPVSTNPNDNALAAISHIEQPTRVDIDIAPLTILPLLSSTDINSPRPPPRAKTSLTVVLDNVVILEELLNEIVAIIEARRALGVDQVDFR